MNRFRKILSAALVGCMAVSALMMSAGAANTGTEAAREKAIYGSQAWTVNGAAAIQHSDGTVEPVPEFSALYPGWTVPKQAASVSSTALAEVADIGSHSISGYYRNVYLTQDVKYKPFYSFLGNGETVSAFAVTIPGSKYNLGIYNETAQKAVEVEDGDTPETLQKRVMQNAEWILLPQAVSDFCAGRLRVDGAIVHKN